MLYAVFHKVGEVYVPSIFKSMSEALGYQFVVGGFIREMVEDCPRCLRLDPSDVQHFNCLYNGNAVGHSHNGHCTATACF